MAIKTQHFPKLIESNIADFAYNYLRDNIDWIDGVRSRKGFTRKAKPLQFGQCEIVDELLLSALNLMKLDLQSVALCGIYLNYYRNGDDWTPNHSHDTRQLIISLGTTRTLTIGKNPYNMSNGDVITFGKSLHGVPKEPSITNGRISIAVFLM